MNSNHPSYQHAQRLSDAGVIDEISGLDTPDIDALATAARLRLRYSSGPLRRRLDQLLLHWDVSEEALHQLCRQHWAAHVQASPLSVNYGSGADDS